MGRDPFNQNFRKFRSKTQWIGSVQPKKFRKSGSIFWGGPLFPVGPVGILVEWIAPHGLFVFPPKKTLMRRRHCSISQSCCSMASKRSIDWFLWFLESSRVSERSLDQPKATRVCIRSIPIKSLYLRSFVVSVLFARFHFRVYKNRSNEDLSI